MKFKITLVLIFILAFILRFWQLGGNPASLDWDEASLGYNAYSLLKTGKDEYGIPWPLSIRSFGDYKPPLYTYLTMGPVYLFGLNEFSTRFISAFFGTLTIIIGYFLIKELFPNKSSIFYLLFSIFFALSPWHIQFSRIAFEANTALFFFILGTWLFLKGIKRRWYFLPAFVSYSLSVYTYHSPRLIVPIFILGLIIIFRKEIIAKKYSFLAGLTIFILMVIPLAQQMKSATGARFGSVSVINPNEKLGQSIKAIEFDQQKGDIMGKLMHNRRIVYGREILAGYLDHFNFDFLFLSGDAPGRHHAVGMGMLYFWDLPFILLGIIYLLRTFDRNRAVLFWWFIVAPMASALASGTPHAVRALFYLPVYQIFITVGVLEAIRFYKSLFKKSKKMSSRARNERGDPVGITVASRDCFGCGLAMTTFQTDSKTISSKTVRYSLIIFTFLLFLFNFFYYLHMYYIHSPIEYAQWWQYGYKEAVLEVNKIEKIYDKVIVTYRYDQPYVYFLFYNQIDPSWYQQNWGGGEIKRSERNFGKYEFRNIDWKEDEKLTNVLFVVALGEIPNGQGNVVKQIDFPDGTVAFQVVAR